MEPSILTISKQAGPKNLMILQKNLRKFLSRHLKGNCIGEHYICNALVQSLANSKSFLCLEFCKIFVWFLTTELPQSCQKVQKSDFLLQKRLNFADFLVLNILITVFSENGTEFLSTPWNFSWADIKKIFHKSDLGSEISRVNCAAWNFVP